MIPKPDKNGNFVFGTSFLKVVPLLTLAIFSVLIIVLSAISLATGENMGAGGVIIRIISCAVIFAISVFMIVCRPKYVITNEKILLYGKREIYFSEIEQVNVHDNILGMVEINAKCGQFTVPAFDLSCPIKVFAEILTERISVYEQRNS